MIDRTVLRTTLAVVFALWSRPAAAEPPVPPAIDSRPDDGLSRHGGSDEGYPGSSLGDDEREGRQEGDGDGDRAAPRTPKHFHVGGGLAPLVWMPANNPLSVRFELELRWTPSFPWTLVADVSYIQIGESGTTLAEDGIDLFLGGMREWAIGDVETASLFPHVRAGLVFESTSTKRATSAKFIAFRAGPGMDWNFFNSVRLNLDLELGLGLLSIKSGSEGDSALAELTLGLALRLLWGF